jgi:hypothetical protein
VPRGLRTFFVEDLGYGYIPAMRNVGGNADRR